MKILKNEKSDNICKIGITLLSYVFLLVVLIMLLPDIWAGTLSFVNVLQPFIIGFVIAYFLNPAWKKIMSFMNRSKLFSKHPILTKAVSITFLYIVLILLIINCS